MTDVWYLLPPRTEGVGFKRASEVGRGEGVGQVGTHIEKYSVRDARGVTPRFPTE